MGSEQAMLDKIDLAIAEANQTYADSGIHAEVNLVQAMQVPFTETTDMASDLYRLRGDASIRSLREQYHADMVCLLNETTGPYAGIAFLLKGSGTDAYSIVQAKYAVGYFTFVHELGHNLGRSHDCDNAWAGGAFSYSHGNRLTLSGTL
ncbi:MAG: M12 family metallo-peptidase [Limisphaerales bacterium]